MGIQFGNSGFLARFSHLLNTYVFCILALCYNLFLSCSQESNSKLGVVVLACNPSTLEAKAGGS
jgi:hypothetical protein